MIRNTKSFIINNKYGKMVAGFFAYPSSNHQLPANCNKIVDIILFYSYNISNLTFRSPFALRDSAMALRKQFRDLVPEAEYRARAKRALVEMGFELRPPRTSFELATTVVPHILPTTAPELYSRGPGRKSDAESIVDFIRRVWGPWIGTLSRRDLRRLDKSAENAVAGWLHAHKPWPDDLPLPTRSDQVTAEVIKGDLQAARRLLHNARYRNV